MPRNMSFSLTTQMVRCKAKTVTRRLGWEFLEPGDIVNACVKCMGLGKGGKIEVICQIRILHNWPEPLNEMVRMRLYGLNEVVKEGFPGMKPKDFVTMFCEHMRCVPDKIVNRIEFEYVDEQ